MKEKTLDLKGEYILIEYLGEETNVKLNGKAINLSTAVCNALVEDQRLLVIVLAGLAGAMQYDPNIKEEYDKIMSAITIKTV